MDVYAQILYRQGRLEEAMSEILCAAETFEKLGATQDLERCRKIRLRIQEEMDNSVATLEPDSDGELLESGAVYETYQLSVLRWGGQMTGLTSAFACPSYLTLYPAAPLNTHTSFPFSSRTHSPAHVW